MGLSGGEGVLTSVPVLWEDHGSKVIFGQGTTEQCTNVSHPYWLLHRCPWSLCWVKPRIP